MIHPADKTRSLHCNALQHIATHYKTLHTLQIEASSGWKKCHCVAVCCSVLHCVAVCCSVLPCVAVCCRVLPCVVVYCSVHMNEKAYKLMPPADKISARVLQCVAVCCSVLWCVAVCCSALQCCCSVVAVCCSMLQCVAVYI